MTSRPQFAEPGGAARTSRGPRHAGEAQRGARPLRARRPSMASPSPSTTSRVIGWSSPEVPSADEGPRHRLATDARRAGRCAAAAASRSSRPAALSSISCDAIRNTTKRPERSLAAYRRLPSDRHATLLAPASGDLSATARATSRPDASAASVKPRSSEPQPEILDRQRRDRCVWRARAISIEQRTFCVAQPVGG